MFTLFYGLQLNIVIYFIAQIVPALTSFRLVSVLLQDVLTLFEYFLTFWDYRMVQDHLVFFWLRPGINYLFKKPQVLLSENCI